MPPMFCIIRDIFLQFWAVTESFSSSKDTLSGKLKTIFGRLLASTFKGIPEKLNVILSP